MSLSGTGHVRQGVEAERAEPRSSRDAIDSKAIEVAIAGTAIAAKEKAAVVIVVANQAGIVRIIVEDVLLDDHGRVEVGNLPLVLDGV